MAKIQRICSLYGECGTTETYDGYKWKEHWRNFKDKLLCSKHYNRLVSNPKRVYEDRKEKQREYNKIHNPINNPIYGTRELKYKDRNIRLNANPRKGQCEVCCRKVGDGIKRTNLHHIQYHDDDPLKDTIELCIRCHKEAHT